MSTFDKEIRSNGKFQDLSITNIPTLQQQNSYLWSNYNINTEQNSPMTSYDIDFYSRATGERSHAIISQLLSTNSTLKESNLTLKETNAALLKQLETVCINLKDEKNKKRDIEDSFRLKSELYESRILCLQREIEKLKSLAKSNHHYEMIPTITAVSQQSFMISQNYAKQTVDNYIQVAQEYDDIIKHYRNENTHMQEKITELSERNALLEDKKTSQEKSKASLHTLLKENRELQTTIAMQQKNIEASERRSNEFYQLYKSNEINMRKAAEKMCEENLQQRKEISAIMKKKQDLETVKNKLQSKVNLYMKKLKPKSDMPRPAVFSPGIDSHNRTHQFTRGPSFAFNPNANLEDKIWIPYGPTNQE